MRYLLIAAALGILTSFAAWSGPRKSQQTGFLFKSIQVGGETYQYVVYVPRGYAETEEVYPCILFLHGSGESGTDGQKQAIQGIGSAILWNAAKWPFIVIMPQKPDQKKQWEEYDGAVMQMLAETEKAYSIDRKRVYLTGLSQGGHGTWTIAAAHPEVFAALAPICGYVSAKHEGDPDPKDIAELVRKIKHLPVWAFHGLADDVVPPVQTSAIVDALKAAGAGVKVSLYPGVNHGSWDKAYREEELGKWFLEHHR
jgi:predicted peptidase